MTSRSPRPPTVGRRASGGAGGVHGNVGAGRHGEADIGLIARQHRGKHPSNAKRAVTASPDRRELLSIRLPAEQLR